MSSDLVNRRTVLKFAGAIMLVAQSMPSLPFSMGPRHGYGVDPNLLTRPVTWPRLLSESQLVALERLVDLILPSEPPHPSASGINVHEFLDEWISAPYPQMQLDRTLILRGLSRLDEVSKKQTGLVFAQANASRQSEMFEQFCTDPGTAGIAVRLIELVCGGYYTTREGQAAIGYVGNVAQPKFLGPPPEIIEHLDGALTQLISR